MAESETAGGLCARRFVYGAALFIAAAGSLVLEIVAGRLLAPYVGMSLYTWTSIIAVVLAGLSLGNWIGGHLAQRDSASCLRSLIWSFGFAGVTSLTSLLLIRWLSGPILGAGFGPLASITILAAALFFLPVVFAGIVAPILTRLALDLAPESHGRVLGQMYALGALGSIAGTLASGFFFISWIGSSYTVISVAAVYLLTALVLAFDPAKPSGRASSLGALALLGSIVAGVTFAKGAHQGPCQVESDYYCIRVVDFSAESGRPSAALVLDHLGHGINDRDDPTLLYSPYVELTDRLVETRIKAPDKLTAYFVGGGAYTLPRAFMAKYPEAQLLVAEVDPAVTRIAREDLWLQDSDNLQVLHRDARAALQDLPRKPLFDLVLGDAFHDISVPAHLVTAEFARTVRARLRPGGFYALNVVDRDRQPLFLLSVVRTLKSAFASVEVWADAEQLSLSRRITYVVLASDRPSDMDRLQSRQEFGPQWRRWPPEDLAARAAFHPILTDDHAPVDRLLFPVLEASQ